MVKLLWAGTAKAAAIKLSSFFAVLAVGLCLLSAWVPYSMLHRKSTPFRAVLAYLAGFIATIAGMVAALLSLTNRECAGLSGKWRSVPEQLNSFHRSRCWHIGSHGKSASRAPSISPSDAISQLRRSRAQDRH